MTKYLVVITDGLARDASDLPNAISQAEGKGIIRFAIGVSCQTHHEKQTKKSICVTMLMSLYKPVINHNLCCVTVPLGWKCFQ